MIMEIGICVGGTSRATFSRYTLQDLETERWYENHLVMWIGRFGLPQVTICTLCCVTHVTGQLTDQPKGLARSVQLRTTRTTSIRNKLPTLTYIYDNVINRAQPNRLSSILLLLGTS